nr:extracellular serine proteinase-like [Lytechinus pictus]
MASMSADSQLLSRQELFARPSPVSSTQLFSLDDNLLDIVRGLNGVRYIEEDGLATVLGSREPVQYWGLDRIGQRTMPLDEKINFSGNGSGANVFIVDTGIQYNHEDFDGI